jgi:hypothetical protein
MEPIHQPPVRYQDNTGNITVISESLWKPLTKQPGLFSTGWITIQLFLLTSPVFVWGACIDIDGEDPVKDNCFDLITGIPYYVKLNNGEKISVKRTGNVNPGRFS